LLYARRLNIPNRITKEVVHQSGTSHAMIKREETN